jgi:iron complex outermembrane receptor protein
VRTPSRIDRDLFSPATPPFRVAGGRHVVSEKLIAWELGYRTQLNPSFALSSAAFLGYYDDLRSLEPLSPPAAFPVERSSGLRGQSAGVELTGEWRATANWRVHAGYSELRVSSEPQPGEHDRSTRDSIARDPNHQAMIRSYFDFGSGWEWDTMLRYVAHIGNQSVPGYMDLDLRLGWQPGSQWEFSLVGKNLLHREHVEFNSAPGRRYIQHRVFAQVTRRF